MSRIEQGSGFKTPDGNKPTSQPSNAEKITARGLTPEQFRSFGDEYRSLRGQVQEAEKTGNKDQQRVSQMNIARHLSNLKNLNIHIQPEKSRAVLQQLNEGIKLFTQRDGDLPNLLTYLSSVKNIEGDTFSVPEGVKATALDQYQRYMESGKADPAKVAQLLTGLKYLGLIDRPTPQVEAVLIEGEAKALNQYRREFVQTGRIRPEPQAATQRDLVYLHARLNYLGVKDKSKSRITAFTMLRSIAQGLLTRPKESGETVSFDQLHLAMVAKKYLDIPTPEYLWEAGKKQLQGLTGFFAGAWASIWHGLRQPSSVSDSAIVESAPRKAA